MCIVENNHTKKKKRPRDTGSLFRAYRGLLFDRLLKQGTKSRNKWAILDSNQ